MAPIKSSSRSKVSWFIHRPLAACGKPTSALVEKRSTASNPTRKGTRRPFHKSSACASAESSNLRISALTPRVFVDRLDVLPEIREAVGCKLTTGCDDEGLTADAIRS